jgi:hypothetical protein
LHNEELHNLYPSSNVIRAIKSRRMGWARYVARTEETRSASRSLKGRYHSEDLDIDGRIILKCVLGKQGGKVWTGFIWLRIGTSGGVGFHKRRKLS